MFKRAVAAFLWYAMVWVGYEILWSVGGLPRMAGPILAASMATFVVVDPFHRFWPRPERSPSRDGSSGHGADVTAVHSAR
jgi:hypothetical protein